MSFTDRLLLLCLFLPLQHSYSQTLDNTYGDGDGFTVANIGLVHGSKILADNSVIVQSQPNQVRFSKFDVHGNRDMTFGTDGYLSPYDQSGAQGLQGHSNFIIDPQQRILIGMYEFVADQHSIKLKRYFQDGTQDTSFGTDGIFFYPIPAQLQAASPTICFFSDNSVLLHIPMQGSINLPSLLVKLDSDGILDTSFGTNGTVTIPAGSSNFLFTNKSMTVDQDDNIFLAFRTNVAPYDHLIAKFNSMGVADETFQTAPIVAMSGHIWSHCWWHGGKLYLAANVYTSSNSIKIIRLNMDGSPDSTFNEIIVDQLNHRVESKSVTMDHTGKIIAAGILFSEVGISAQKAFVKCYNNDGTVDTTFGNNGEITFDYSRSHFVYPLIQSDNKIVVTGITLNNLLTGNASWNALLSRFTTNNLSVDEPETDNLITLFPNPASTSFTVTPDIAEKIELYDTRGRLVRTYIGNDGPYMLNGLERGLFFLRIVTNSGVSVKKLLKN